MKYYLIGIKGSGMSALAQILADMGHEVQGSDVSKRFFTQAALEERNISIHPFDGKHFEEGQTVIVSSAYPDDHIDVQVANDLNLPVYRYHEFLGIFAMHFSSVAVTGSHGKTSTTGLLAHVMKEFAPSSFLVGDGDGHGVKDSQYFIFEACEYRRHFLNYYPDYCVMTNIDFDHPDYFSGVEDVFSSFQQLAHQVRKAIIAYGDDGYLRDLHPEVPVWYYGLAEGNDVRADHISVQSDGTTFAVYIQGDFYETLTIPSFGTHNVLNALAVVTVAYLSDVPSHILKTQMAGFPGVQRRFSETFLGNQVLIDDYAHHPKEIQATIEAARQKYPEHQIISIFQPHTYTRTETFLQSFADSLSLSDKVFLCDIFSSAREEHGDLTIDELLSLLPSSSYLTKDDMGQLQAYDQVVLLFMGAGDIQKYQKAYENLLDSSHSVV